MRRYRVLLPLSVQPREGGSYTQYDEFENVRSGLLEIVPVLYRVTGGSVVHGTEPGGEFYASLPVGNEAQLVAGGHIERVDKPATQKKGK
jgi:hypothetical protein